MVSSTVTVGGGCVRHTMAGLGVNYVQQYLHHIVDGSPPKAEYVRHFEARSLAKIEAHLCTKVAMATEKQMKWVHRNQAKVTHYFL